MDDDEFEEAGNVVKFPASSAPFHAVEGLLFIRGDMSYRISKIYEADPSLHSQVSNEARLKEVLFARIMLEYNRRIDKYNLTYAKLTRADRSKFTTKIIKTSISEPGSGGTDPCGDCAVFPVSFVCSNCSDYQSPHSLKGFDPTKCRTNGCNGRYEQVTLVRWCPACGRVERLWYVCKNDPSHPIKLLRHEKNLPRTWRFKCAVCTGQELDILRFQCNHLDNPKAPPVTSLPTEDFIPLMVKEGGVFAPVVLSTVDIPETTPPLEEKDIDYYLLGIYLGKFAFLASKPEDVLKELKERMSTFKNPPSFFLEQIERAVPGFNTLSEDEKKIELGKQLRVDKIRDVVHEVKHDYSELDIFTINEFLALKGIFGNDVPALSYSEFIRQQRDDVKRKVLERQYEDLRNDCGIIEISYIEKINLITSCVGTISGINRYYDDQFVPHFDPLWDQPNRRANFHSLIRPFWTEGILFEMNPLNLVRFLEKEGVKGLSSLDGTGAKAYLMKMTKDSDPFNIIEKVLHSISHALIRKSSMRTGLDGDSLGEMLFPAAGAFFVYSRSSINTGGLGFVFEHSLKLWLDDAREGLDCCTFDPICIHDRGACFACMYLPEHVCSMYNKSLDRDVFVGKHRFHSKFW
jgi:hypothetical protein